MLGILPGLISPTIRCRWAIVAPPEANTVVIREVLRFWRTLTKLSPSIKCDVPSGGCCVFIAGRDVDRLKQTRGSFSGTPVNLFFTWLFFCTSNNRDAFCIGISLIFLSRTSQVFVGNVVLSAPVLFIVSWESSTLPVSSNVSSRVFLLTCVLIFL